MMSSCFYHRNANKASERVDHSNDYRPALGRELDLASGMD